MSCLHPDDELTAVAEGHECLAIAAGDEATAEFDQAGSRYHASFGRLHKTLFPSCMTMLGFADAVHVCPHGLLCLVFVWLKPPKVQPDTKTLKQCPTCKKWSQV